MKRKLLFVDDEPRILEGLQNLLRKHRSKWDMTFVTSAQQALAELEKSPYDVIVSDIRPPQMDGAKLLKKVQESFPSVVRIVLSGHAELETTLRAVPVAHQFLAKPCNPDVLEKVIERACNLQALINDETVRRAVGKTDKLPSMPKAYFQLMETLSNERASLKDVAHILKQDMAMSAKILHLVNSAFFRLSRRISDIDEAVAYLGISNVKYVTLAAEVFRGNVGLKNGSGLSVDRIQAHSLYIGSLASQMLTDKRQKEDAFVAGLLHDIGKFILLVEMPEHMETVLRHMREERAPMHVVEKTLYGVTHAEVGGYLLGIWGIPHAVVEAVANHHAPQRVEQECFDVLSAVYAANELANEQVNGATTDIACERPPIDESYLKKQGVEERLSTWRQLAVDYGRRLSGGGGRT
jgi:HD-like signal output (HDOD) protein